MSKKQSFTTSLLMSEIYKYIDIIDMYLFWGGCIIIEIYSDIPELKMIISRTRERLNKLVASEKNHHKEEVLELSRKLDNLIHSYLILERELKS